MANIRPVKPPRRLSTDGHPLTEGFLGLPLPETFGRGRWPFRIPGHNTAVRLPETIRAPDQDAHARFVLFNRCSSRNGADVEESKLAAKTQESVNLINSLAPDRLVGVVQGVEVGRLYFP